MSVYSDTVNTLLPDVYFRLGELSGVNAVDETGTYSGTYVNSPVLGATGLILGDSDKCVEFTGNTQYVDTDTGSLFLAASPFTVSFLFNRTSSNDSHILNIPTDSGTFIVANVGPNFAGYGDLAFGGIGVNIKIAFGLINAQTYHVVINYNGAGRTDIANYTAYVDEVSIALEVAQGMSETATNMLISKRNGTGSNGFIGSIDEVAVWVAKEFTQEEVTTLYNASQLKAFDIIIDHTKVDEDLYDFPLLVNLGSSSGINVFDSSAIFNNVDIGSRENLGFNSITSHPNLLLTNGDKTVDGDGIAIWTSAFSNQTIGSGFAGYVEFVIESIDGAFMLGFCESDSVNDDYITNLQNGFGMYQNTGVMNLRVGSTNYTSSLPSFAISDVIGMSLDYDGMILKTYKNGTLYDTFDLINDYLVSQHSLRTYTGMSPFSNASSTIRLIDSEFTNKPVGVDAWSSYDENNVKTLNAIYINPADNDQVSYATEVMQLNPIAYWRLGDLTGSSIAVDETGSHDAVYTGTPSLEIPGLVAGDSNTSVSVNGGGDAIDGFSVGGVVSAVMLCAGTNTTTYQTIIASWQGVNDGRIHIEFVSDTAYPKISIIGGNSAYGDIILTDGLAHMIVVSYNGITTEWWIDNVKQTNSFSGNLFADPFIVIGNHYFNGSYVGGGERIIDEVSLFSDALTEGERLSLYNNFILDSTIPSDQTIISQQCKVEIDRWDQVNQQAQLWVKVPYISKDTDTIINLSFDPANADNYLNIGYTGEVPAQAVWSEYDAVYHLSKDGGDSAIGGLDCTLVNMGSSNIVDFGIGKGLSFNGIDEHITLTSDDLARIYNISMLMDLDDVIGQQALFDGANGGWYMNGDKLSYNLTSDGISSLLALTPYDVVLQDNSGVGSTFINGVFVDSITPDAVNLIIDHIATETSIPANWFAGKLKEIRFSKSLKTLEWISTNYNSTQDSLVRYSNADNFILDKHILGSITENVAVVDWIIRAYRLDTGELTAQLQAIAGAFSLPVPVGSWYPSMVTVSPEQGIQWTPVTAQLVDDLIFPIDPETTPYYFKCTVSDTGIDGVTDSVEPTWPTVPGQTVVDGTVTWEVVERMIQPITHSPMIPK